MPTNSSKLKEKKTEKKKGEAGGLGTGGPDPPGDRRSDIKSPSCHFFFLSSSFILLSSILSIPLSVYLGSYKPCQQVRSLLVETVVTYNRHNFRDKS